MNIKQRGVSFDNPFEKKNIPSPLFLLSVETEKILPKQGCIKNLRETYDDKPLAGRFSEIGEKILQIGCRKASQICTGNWGDLRYDESMDLQNEKISVSPHKEIYRPGDNHT